MRHLCRFPYVNASCGIGGFRRRRFKRFGASPLTQAFMLVYSSLRAAFNAVLGKLFNIQISTCSIGCSFRSYFSSVGAVAFGCLRFVGGQIDWRDLRNCREAMRRYREIAIGRHRRIGVVSQHLTFAQWASPKELTSLRSRRESNPHLRFRKPLFYPLNYGDGIRGEEYTH